MLNWGKLLSLFIFLAFLTGTSEAALRSPFVAAVTKASSPLTNYSLSQFTMVGTINSNGKIWGIIRAPNTHVYSVAVGNTLGNDNDKVLQITSQQITVGKNNNQGQMAITTLWLTRS